MLKSLTKAIEMLERAKNSDIPKKVLIEDLLKVLVGEEYVPGTPVHTVRRIQVRPSEPAAESCSDCMDCKKQGECQEINDLLRKMAGQTSYHLPGEVWRQYRESLKPRKDPKNCSPSEECIDCTIECDKEIAKAIKDLTNFLFPNR